MNSRTMNYLKNRFGDYYSEGEIVLPPNAVQREWGFIPWTSGPDTTMVRHRSLLDFGTIDDMLQNRRPQHVYFSVGKYDDPSASKMNDKGWQNSDLVFDLDADHLDTVTLGEDTYAEMLSKCKDSLFRLLDLLDTAFDFDDMTITFSGGRGYHVHVRDEGIQNLGRDERRQIVDYIKGTNFELDMVTIEKTVDSDKYGTKKTKFIDTRGGWGKRIHTSFMEYIDELLEMDTDEAIERLTLLDGVGDKRASTALNAMEEQYEQIEDGRIDVHIAVIKVIEKYALTVVEEENAHIDEPVTTDTNRLIRLPGTLHGGSALEVQHLERDELDEFDPLVDAVPNEFTDKEVTVTGTTDASVTLRNETYSITEDEDVTLPEYAGLFFMARGQAEKAK